VRDFVFGEGIDEPLMMEQADLLDFDEDQDTDELTRHFYHRNALGSVMALTDMAEAVAVSYRYDPYGAVTITRNGTPQSSDPLGNPWTFTARQLDEETGLYHYRARAYDPATGRFLQRDPVGYEVGPSLYAYARSSPTTLVDPDGQNPEEHSKTQLRKRLDSYLAARKALQAAREAFQGTAKALAAAEQAHSDAMEAWSAEWDAWFDDSWLPLTWPSVSSREDCLHRGPARVRGSAPSSAGLLAAMDALAQARAAYAAAAAALKASEANEEAAGKGLLLFGDGVTWNRYMGYANLDGPQVLLYTLPIYNSDRPVSERHSVDGHGLYFDGKDFFILDLLPPDKKHAKDQAEARLQGYDDPRFQAGYAMTGSQYGVRYSYSVEGGGSADLYVSHDRGGGAKWEVYRPGRKMVERRIGHFHAPPISPYWRPPR
jgi:RHS repeat-associated protein